VREHRGPDSLDHHSHANQRFHGDQGIFLGLKSDLDHGNEFRDEGLDVLGNAESQFADDDVNIISVGPRIFFQIREELLHHVLEMHPYERVRIAFGEGREEGDGDPPDGLVVGLETGEDDIHRLGVLVLDKVAALLKEGVESQQRSKNDVVLLALGALAYLLPDLAVPGLVLVPRDVAPRGQNLKASRERRSGGRSTSTVPVTKCLPN
jgi:hypothetical protein